MDLLRESENVVLFRADERATIKSVLYDNNISGRLFKKLKRENSFYLNGKVAESNTVVNQGDIISIVMENEVDNTIPEEIPLDIIYEDFDLLIINKPPNRVVHPTKSHQSGTISNGISYYYKEKGIKKKIRFVNRLDMDTSGILVVAKNQYSHQQMAIQFEENTVIKKYMALVNGVVKSDSDIIDLPIGKDEDNSIKKIVTIDGKKAITKYKVISRYNNATLVEVQIFTGRSHQIRVHLNHIGHPIIGDTLYSEGSPLIDRQALHANYIKFKHPRTHEDMEINIEFPKDIKSLINTLSAPKC